MSVDNHEGPSIIERFRNVFLSSGLYHALYRASEYVGGETWGDNKKTHREFISKIPDDLRKNGDFRMLLLGSATPTSIEQAVKALEEWEHDGLIKNGRLTVIDLKDNGLKGLANDIRSKVDLIQGDITKIPIGAETFHFISSDYILNFVPKEELSGVISNFEDLLVPQGVFSAAVDTTKTLGNFVGKLFVRNQLTETELNNAVSNKSNLVSPVRAISRGLAKINELGANRIVWGFQKK